MRTLGWIGLGSGLGGVARLLMIATIPAVAEGAFPLGILMVNLAGSALIGALAAGIASKQRMPAAPRWNAFFMTGFCGGFTTFSFFSLETWQLIEAGQLEWAVVYSLSTMGGSVLAAGVGYASIHRLWKDDCAA